MSEIVDDRLRITRVAPTGINRYAVATAGIGDRTVYVSADEVRQARNDLGDYLQAYRQKLGDKRVDELIAYAVQAREHMMVLASTHDDSCDCSACAWLDGPMPWTHWHI